MDLRNYTIYSITYCLNLVRLCYVGSTNNFEKRKKEHIGVCFNINSPKYNTKLYTAMRKYGIENFKFMIEYELKSATKQQSFQMEELYRKYLNANLNSIRCFIPVEEKKDYHKKYYEENADKIKDKKYRENNKDKIKEYQEKYYEEHKEEILEQQKKYREDNKERLTEKKECVCGGKFTLQHKSSHENSKLHKNYILKNLLCD